jgi:hypothetical protein
MRFLAVKNEARRKGTPELAQVLHGALPTLIAAHVEGSLASDLNLDIVAFLQFECLDYRCR